MNENILLEEIKKIHSTLLTFETKFQSIGKRFDLTDKKLLAIEKRLDKIESRLDNIDTRLNNIDGRLNRIDTRLDSIEDRVDIAIMKADRLFELDVVTKSDLQKFAKANSLRLA